MTYSEKRVKVDVKVDTAVRSFDFRPQTRLINKHMKSLTRFSLGAAHDASGMNLTCVALSVIFSSFLPPNGGRPNGHEPF